MPINHSRNQKGKRKRFRGFRNKGTQGGVSCEFPVAQALSCFSPRRWDSNGINPQWISNGCPPSFVSLVLVGCLCVPLLRSLRTNPDSKISHTDCFYRIALQSEECVESLWKMVTLLFCVLLGCVWSAGGQAELKKLSEGYKTGVKLAQEQINAHPGLQQHFQFFRSHKKSEVDVSPYAYILFLLLLWWFFFLHLQTVDDNWVVSDF